MPDIPMCKDNSCTLKDKCYRFKAKKSKEQSYFLESPKKDDDKCRFFWEVSESGFLKL